MQDRYDCIVVGSGFGGSVLACRLAQAGRKVLVLERGRRWQVEDYPSVSQDNWSKMAGLTSEFSRRWRWLKAQVLAEDR